MTEGIVRPVVTFVSALAGVGFKIGELALRKMIQN
jgi:hypothetical protein